MADRIQLDPDGRVKLSSPRLYAVIMYNDDYTTMDFVVTILMKVFHKTETEAQALMLEVHNAGKSAVGIYPYDLAVTRRMQAEQLAAKHAFPLKITVDIAEG